MKLRIIISFVFCFLFWGCHSENNKVVENEKKVGPLKMRVSDVATSKGHKYWLLTDKNTPVVVLKLAFHRGYAYDQPTHFGVSLMCTEMMMKGSGEYDEEKLRGILEDKGASVDFSASKDFIICTVTMLRSNYEEVLRLVKTILSQPRFDQKSLTEVKTNFVAGLASQKPRAMYMIQEKMSATILKNHPYGKLPLNTKEEILKITSDDLHKVHQEILSSPLFITVVGNISQNEITPFLDELLPKPDSLSQKSTLPKLQLASLDKQVFPIPADVRQVTILGVQKGPDMLNKDLLGLSVVVYILNKRIFDVVRTERGLAYATDVGFDPMRYGGLINCYAGTKKESTAEVLKLIGQEWAKMQKEGPTEKERQDAIQYMINAYLMGFTNSSRIANILNFHQASGRKPSYINDRTLLLENFSLKDLKRLAKKYLQPSKMKFYAHGIEEKANS